MPCDGGGRDGSYTAASPGTPENVYGHQKLEEARKGPLQLSEGAQPAGTLILDFWPPELWANKFLSFKPAGVWYFVMAALGNECTYINDFSLIKSLTCIDQDKSVSPQFTPFFSSWETLEAYELRGYFQK